MNSRKLLGMSLAAVLGIGLALPEIAIGKQAKKSAPVARIEPKPIVSSGAGTPAEKEVVDFVNTFAHLTATQTRDGKVKDAVTLAKDQETMAKMVSEDYVFVNTEGQALGKTQMLLEVRRGLSFVTFSVVSQDIKIHGNSAIVTGTFAMNGTLNGKRVTGQFKGIQVLEKQDSGQWVATAGSVTKISAPAARTK